MPQGLSPGTAAAAPSEQPSYIANRYRLEAELGRGGMGAVYRARDVGSDLTVALKLLTSTDQRARELFQREFQTLAKLAHPRVISVYEYGTTSQGHDFYTMELLGGRDLAEMAPLSWRAVCKVVRDVCTSLSLLHGQRMVHRDVNPRNVRVDDAGGAKLLDFGALASFGAAREIVGAPSCVAPEALHCRPLDGRTDLFALGVVIYWALTRRLPFAIERLEHADEAWQRYPIAPSTLVPGIPRALDELVLSLLSIDPLGRPASAADVLDRVSAVAPQDDAPLSIAESHVTSATLVGRAREFARMQELVTRARSGHGAVLCVVSERGGGKTRLLRELVIHAQVSGLVTLELSARACAADEDLAAQLVRSLMQRTPAEARASSALGSWSALSRDGSTAGLEQPRTGQESLAETFAHERLLRLQLTVARLVTQVADQVPLLICIDDIDVLSGHGAALLPMLAHATLDRTLLIATSRTAGVSSAAVEQLTLLGPTLTLAPLQVADVERLITESFGDVPYCTRLSHWLMLASRGNPSRLRAALLQLVHRHVVRYAGGAWLLPADLSVLELPRDVEGIAPSELLALSADARELLHYLAACRAPLDELWINDLVEGATEALALLAHKRLIVRADARAALAQTAVGDDLLAQLSEGKRRDLHARLAALLLARIPGPVEALRSAHFERVTTDDIILGLSAGRHLLLAGQEREATRILRNGAIELTIRGDGLALAAPLLEEAVELYRARGRSRRSYAAMMAALALAGTYTDWRLERRYGEEILQALADVSGLTLVRRLRRYLGGRLALCVGLLVGFVMFTLVPQRRMMNKFREALLGLMGIGSGALGVATILQDPQRASRILETLSPLRFFPPSHAVRNIFEFQLAFGDHARGRYAEARERSSAALSYVRSERAKRALPERAQAQLEVGILIVLGGLDTCRTDRAALQTLEDIERIHTSTSRQTYAASRMTYHGNRGERDRYLHWRERTDRLAAENGSTWRNDVQVPRMLWSTHMLCGDVLTLKRDMEQVGELAAQVPTLTRLRDILHACYLCERGMPGEALASYEDMLRSALTEPGLRGLQQLGLYARLLRKAGRSEEAVAICARSLATVTGRDEAFTVLLFPLRWELSSSLIALGEFDRARTHLDSLLQAQEGHDNPMLHGLTHAACAELALATHDFAGVDRQLEAMRTWLANAPHPTLFAQYHRLVERARHDSGNSSPAHTDARGQAPSSHDTELDNDDFHTELVPET